MYSYINPFPFPYYGVMVTLSLASLLSISHNKDAWYSYISTSILYNNISISDHLKMDLTIN